MKPEELTERLDKSFNNSPEDNIEQLPKDLEDALAEKVMSQAERFLKFVMTAGLGVTLSGAISQAFWAGHDYFKEHGELRGDHIDSV